MSHSYVPEQQVQFCDKSPSSATQLVNVANLDILVLSIF